MMLSNKVARFAASIEELPRDSPNLPADDDLRRRFHALLEDEELEAVFCEFKVSSRSSDPTHPIHLQAH
jgi:hypothetical protein